MAWTGDLNFTSANNTVLFKSNILRDENYGTDTSINADAVYVFTVTGLVGRHSQK